MRLYVAGPMSGCAEHNFPAFREAARQLQQAGYEVTDPSTLGEHADWSWADYLKRDLPELLKCDGVALLPGWHASNGAQLERDVATRLDMHAVPATWWTRNAWQFRVTA